MFLAWRIFQIKDGVRIVLRLTRKETGFCNVMMLSRTVQIDFELPMTVQNDASRTRKTLYSLALVPPYSPDKKPLVYSDLGNE